MEQATTISIFTRDVTTPAEEHARIERCVFQFAEGLASSDEEKAWFVERAREIIEEAKSRNWGEEP